jgi:hypothetical protein
VPGNWCPSRTETPAVKFRFGLSGRSGSSVIPHTPAPSPTAGSVQMQMSLTETVLDTKLLSPPEYVNPHDAIGIRGVDIVTCVNRSPSLSTSAVARSAHSATRHGPASSNSDTVRQKPTFLMPFAGISPTGSVTAPIAAVEPFFGQDRMSMLIWRLKQYGLQERVDYEESLRMGFSANAWTSD